MSTTPAGTSPTPRHRVAGEDGGVILGWLTRLVVVLGLLAVLGYNAAAIGAAHLTAADAAQAAATAAASSWRSSHNLQAAYDAAAASDADRTDHIWRRDFWIAQDGTAHVTLTKTATTLFLQQVTALRHWTVVTVTASAAPPQL
ncbi:MAG: hypothetical protein ACYCXA_10705 [Actinomycetes bacterium]